MSREKSPWIAAFLNFIFWGAGYLYIRHRMILGIGLTVIMAMNFMILISIPAAILLPMSELFFVWLSFVWAALSAIFAFDAYREAAELARI